MNSKPKFLIFREENQGFQIPKNDKSFSELTSKLLRTYHLN